MENKDLYSASVNRNGGGYEDLEVFEKTSKRITSLRFLLAILVVFIHNNFNVANIEQMGLNFEYTQNAFGKFLQILISECLASCAVPLFFVFSGFFQGLKNEKYLHLLKKKAKSLLLPYILWLSFYSFCFAFLKLLVAQFLPSLFGNPKDTCLVWTLKDWFNKTIGYGVETSAPVFAQQFWFLRDLIIFTIFSPILKFFIKKMPIVFLIFSIFMYFLPLNLFFVASSGLFFYILGLYWGNYKIDLFKIVDKIGFLEIFILLALFFVYRYKIGLENSVVIGFMIVATCVIFLKFSSIIVKTKKCFSISKYLAGFSFWLYAIHMPLIIGMLQKFCIKFLSMKNTFFCLLEYFGVSILTIFIAILLGILLKKICPKLFTLLCGGR